MGSNICVITILICTMGKFATAQKQNIEAREQATSYPIKGIEYYEPLNYSMEEVHRQHIAAVSLDNPVQFVRIRFFAFGRRFLIKARQNRNAFSSDVKFESVSQGGTEGVNFDHNEIYEGVLEGFLWSSINGRITSGLFDGVLHVQNESYHVEPVWRHFASPVNFHSVIYTASSVKFDPPIRQRRAATIEKSRLKVENAGEARHRREKPDTKAKNRNTCLVHIVADHLFYEHVADRSEVQATAEMVHHVIEADKVFRATDFNQDGGPGDNVGLAIAAVTVYKDKSAEGSLGSASDTSILDFLSSWSELDHSDFCLAMLFTYKDFSDGTLGLAWLAEASAVQTGGICSPRVVLEFSGKEASFNTAVISLLNYGARVPRREASITVTHEFGHNFGSPHDPSACTPGGELGNYMMYSKASDGSKANNRLFSPCSKRAISPVIDVRGPLCFVAHNGSICGNKIVEEGEMCDCGEAGECDMVDPCCTAPNTTTGIPGCTIRTGKQCSPKAGSCCTSSCQFVTGGANKLCRGETQCSQPSTCNGVSGKCPHAVPKPNSTTCNSGANTCYNGLCVGSICSNYGRHSCECTDVEELCHVCCASGNEGKCESLKSLLGKVLFKPGGSTCNSYTGFCNAEGSCITVDQDDQIKKMNEAFERFFSQRSLDKVVLWMKQRWYYVLAIVCSVFLMLFLLRVTYRKRASIRALTQQALQPYTLRYLEDRFRSDPRTEMVGGAHSYKLNEGGGSCGSTETPNLFSQYGMALRRLEDLFPETDSATLAQALRYSTDEQTAVKRLLGLGHTITYVWPSEQNEAEAQQPGAGESLPQSFTI